jgi:MraZ protein
MTNFIGEYECKIDAKGRLSFPSALKKQLSLLSEGRFVVNRGMEDCLVLYQQEDWTRISDKVNKLNQFVKKNRMFVRRFNNGATQLELDSSNRLLFPKRLLEYAEIDKRCVLFAYGDKIEIWSYEKYQAMMTEDDGDDYADLAEEVMGDINDADNVS